MSQNQGLAASWVFHTTHADGVPGDASILSTARSAPPGETSTRGLIPPPSSGPVAGRGIAGATAAWGRSPGPLLRGMVEALAPAPTPVVGTRMGHQTRLIDGSTFSCAGGRSRLLILRAPGSTRGAWRTRGAAGAPEPTGRLHPEPAACRRQGDRPAPLAPGEGPRVGGSSGPLAPSRQRPAGMGVERSAALPPELAVRELRCSVRGPGSRDQLQRSDALAEAIRAASSQATPQATPLDDQATRRGAKKPDRRAIGDPIPRHSGLSPAPRLGLPRARVANRRPG